jgi:DNA-binding response OmpR family regulator
MSVPCPTVGRVADVLIVEDDAMIRTALVRALSARQHSTMTAPTALEGLQSLVAHRPDVVLLDLGLPDLDGSALLAMIRAVSDVPVIVVSARDDGAGIVALLDAGADDYLVKPFAADQLDARIRAVLRRADPGRAPGPLVVGELTVDARSRQATLAGTLLELSPKEFDLLAYLAERAGEVVAKRELLAKVWNQPYGGADKTVDVHLHWLRRKLGETAEEPRYLHRVRGVGIRLSPPP